MVFASIYCLEFRELLIVPFFGGGERGEGAERRFLGLVVAQLVTGRTGATLSFSS